VRVVVKQSVPPADEVTTEILATSIVEIARGIRRLRDGRLTDDALFLLLQPLTGGLPRKHIKVVFDAIDRLERTYVKKPAK